MSRAQRVVYKYIVGQMFNILDYNRKEWFDEVPFYIYDDYFGWGDAVIWRQFLSWRRYFLKKQIDFAKALLLLQADANFEQ